MIREVCVVQAVYERRREPFRGPRTVGVRLRRRSTRGCDLVFRDFERLTYDVAPAVRTYTIVDPFFGPVVFVGVLIETDVVEIASFDDDPDYWSTIDDERE